MKRSTNDVWYVRTPDGRVLRAGSTAAVRHNVRKGRVLPTSLARRSAQAPWVPLSQIDAFADLARPTTPAPRPAPAPANGPPGDAPLLRVAEGRGVADELLAALDAALSRWKLTVACLAGVALLLAEVPLRTALASLELPGPWALTALVRAAQLLVLAVAVAALTRLTHAELSAMRPVTWAEARGGGAGLTLRLLLAYLLVPGLALALIAASRLLPEALVRLGAEAGAEAAWREPLFAAGVVGGLLLQVLLWVVIGNALLLAAVLTVEECSVAEALGQWVRLLRESPARVFLFEGLAIALGLAVSLPLALPIWLGLAGMPGLETNLTTRSAAAALTGAACGPLIAYLAVANVFIYLNLRYEYSPRMR